MKLSTKLKLSFASSALILGLMSVVLLGGQIAYAAGTNGSVTVHFDLFGEMLFEAVLIVGIGVPSISVAIVYAIEAIDRRER